ncbi:MAG: hypothetical protein NZ518_10920 [Dehalococcoidia bacterium]|nr:hypothetical protein [Dehalococcoidia bacterium]
MSELIAAWYDAAARWADATRVSDAVIAEIVLQATGGAATLPRVQTSGPLPIAPYRHLPIGGPHGRYTLEQAQLWLERLTREQGIAEDFLVVAICRHIEDTFEEAVTNASEWIADHADQRALIACLEQWRDCVAPLLDRQFLETWRFVHQRR